MKKTFTFLFTIFAAISLTLNAQIIFQSSFENWTNNIPDGWNGIQTNIGAGNAVQYTTSAQAGTSAIQLINTTTSHKRYTTQALPIIATQSYDITFWVRGQGEVRTGIYNGVNATQNVYNPYIVVNSSTWTMHKQTVISNETNNLGEFIFSLRSTNATNDHLQIDNVTIEFSTSSMDTVTIYDIQYTTLPNGDSPLLGQQVYTKGIVTAFYSSGFFIQDGTGPWSGLYIHNNTNTVAIGDSVILAGTVAEYFNNTQLTQITVFQKLGVGTVPAPTIITTAQVNTEAYEGVLVKVLNATCTNPTAGFGMFEVNDGSGVCKVDKLIYEFTATLNTKYDVTGPVYFSFDYYKIEPRSALDVTISTSIENIKENPISIYPNPATDIVKIKTNNNSTINIINVVGKTIYNSNVPQNETTIDVSTWSQGIYFVNIINENGKKNSYKLIKQ